MDNPARIVHKDERIGRIAVDLGLLTRRQADDILAALAMSRAGGASSSFVRVAVDGGLLDGERKTLLETEALRISGMIHGYEILDVIGKGTIATVYLALQLAMERKVALKILHPDLAEDPEFVKAYLEEARAVSRFHHPNIVQGIDAGESNGYYYFAHEYLSGGSLADRVPRLESGAERFEEHKLLEYLRQTAAALRHAWAVAVYHGDINPGNLLLDGQSVIKLANLGVPRVAKMTNTAAGKRLGFVRCGPKYAAPEQLDSPETVNAATDIYSLGATFYHLSFGAPPFPGKTAEEILKERRRNPVPSFSIPGQEGFSSKYLRLVREMLDVDPANRAPSNPEELMDLLEKFHAPELDSWSGLARQMRRISLPSRRRRNSARHAPRQAAPAGRGRTRVYSLASRPERMRSGRGLKWAAAAAALAIVAALARLWL